MRLSDDKARRLTWLVWRDRAWRWLPVVALSALLLGAVLFATEMRLEHADPMVDVKAHQATVLQATHRAARGAAIVHVHLDDGRDVDAISLFRLPPAAGSHVIVNEARHASGRLTYDVVRFTD